MGDHNDGFSPGNFVHRMHELFFGDAIQGTGCFIEDQNIRVMVKGSSDAEPLALPATAQSRGTNQQNDNWWIDW